MYAIYGNIYHQYTPNVSIYTIHGSYGYMVGSSNVPEMAIEWYTEQENKGKRFFFGPFEVIPAVFMRADFEITNWWNSKENYHEILRNTLEYLHPYAHVLCFCFSRESI